MRDAPESGRLEQPREAPSLLRFAGFILDLDARTLVRETGEAVALTRGEFALLRVFVTRPGRVLSRDAVLDAFANRRFEPFDRSVDVMVGKLRRKIEPDSKQPRLIVTVPGEGYRFDGLAKSPLSGQGLAMAVPSSGNDASPREDALSDAPPERRAEHDLLEAEAKQASAGGNRSNEIAGAPSLAAWSCCGQPSPPFSFWRRRAVGLSSRAKAQRRPRPRAFRSLCCPSSISAAIRRRIISSTHSLMN